MTSADDSRDAQEGPPRAGGPRPGDAAAAHRQAVAARRAEARARLAELEGLIGQIVAASEDSNADDEHDPEGQTIAWDRAQTAALADETRAAIADLDTALARIDAGWDGTCVDCGRPIPPGRLEARPAAERCVECASRRRRR